jgi:signal transduction histidine kinase
VEDVRRVVDSSNHRTRLAQPRSWLALLLAPLSLLAEPAAHDPDALSKAPWYFSVDEALASPSPVFKLDLSGQDLTALSPALFALTDLQILLLNDNRLEALPPELERLSRLSELELNGNRFTQFPDVVFSLRHLHELELNSNQLETIPEGIARLADLTELEARHNRLVALPASLAEMAHLEEIKVDHNRIDRIAPEIFRLPRLIEITFSHNLVETLEAGEDWSRNRSLRELDVSHNRLTQLPPALFQLPLDTCHLWQPTLHRLNEAHFRWLASRRSNDSQEFALSLAERGDENALYYLGLLQEQAKGQDLLVAARTSLLAAKVFRILRRSGEVDRALHDALAALDTFAESDAAEERSEARTEAESLHLLAESLLAQTDAELLAQKLSLLFRGFLLLAIIALSAVLGTVFLSRRRLQQAHRRLSAQTRTIEEQTAHLTRLNATKDRLFSIIGHDLRNPFNAIRGLADQLAAAAAKAGRGSTARQAHFISSAALEASAILDNLLSWARTQDGSLALHPEIIDASVLVHAVLELHGPNFVAGDLSPTVETEPGLKVFADRRTLEAALRNLLSNAIKFTPPGGRLHLSALHRDGLVQFSVEDSGPGLSAAQLEAVLSPEGENPEQSRMRAGEARGLGLILCRDFVARNEGTLAVASTPGNGACFTISLPLAALPKARSPVLAVPCEQSAGSHSTP